MRIVSGALVALVIGSARADDTDVASEAARSAQWIATALMSSGYKADFSLESLHEVDRFIDEYSRDGEPLPGGLLSENAPFRMWALGAYVGEVIRRRSGGKWYGELSDADSMWEVELRMGNGAVIWPMKRVINRLRQGREESVYCGHLCGCLAKPVDG